MIRANVESMQCHPTGNIRARKRATLTRLAVLAAGLLLLAITGRAQADCNTFNYRTGTASFTGATITLPNNLYAGMVLWTSAPAPVANPLSGNCSGTTQNGLTNQIAGQASSSDYTLFPTGIAGLSYRILFNGSNGFTNAPDGIQAYGHQSSGSGNITFDGTGQLRLVVTDPVAFASAKSASISGQIAQWNVYGCFWLFFCNEGDAINFTTSRITFVTPACNTPNVTVVLPTVATSAFGGSGTTAGETHFNLPLTCSAAVNVAVTFATNTPAGKPGVISNTSGSGYAPGVGVQLLDGTCSNTVSFGTAISQPDKTSNGVNNLPFCARYYQTGASMSAGMVRATATYTLTYQ